MTSWLDRPGSLSWANNKKLIEEISILEKNSIFIKERLQSLLAQVNGWEMLCKDLGELGSRQLLTAKHILRIKPFLDCSEHFKTVLNDLRDMEKIMAEKEDHPSPRT